MHPDGAYLITVGEMTKVVRKFPYVPLSVSTLDKGDSFAIHRHFITVSKGSDGLLVVSIELRDKDDHIIVKLDEDGFVVGPQFLKLHPNKSTLIVTDLRGEEMLKIVYAAKHYLWIRARVIVNGNLITDTSALGHYCLPAVDEEGIEVMPPS